ncbi:glycosyltransferase [Clostridium sp. 1001275B_160808_H3]|uniref:glycosyltransferase family 2 protein n=1 Tax=Clostridium sp. 1001275B_160808_H3 TaxID=2787110 RepID=UPI001FACD93D|nr:glycosyltransferase [Clostridium sp. 1001275B_160808_H3]
MQYDESLVSIVMPTYNSDNYISESIKSVISQTYENWELIIVDDNSTDNTEEVVKEYLSIHSNIKYIRFEENKGAAEARNEAILLSKGRFLAFLDSDDLWYKNKLEYQLNFMINNNIEFSFSDYELIDNQGESLNKIIRMPKSLSYEEYLRNTIIQTVTVMIDRKYIEQVNMPLIRRRQDFACWLSILKKGIVAISVQETLAKYRRAQNSLSSNKIKAVKGTWYVYREIERLNIVKTIYVFIGYAWNACKKRIYFNKILNLKIKY